MTKLSFLFAILLFAEIHASGEEKKDEFGIEWCIGRKASSDTRQLKCLRSLSESQKIKDGFTNILRRHRTCPKCKAIIVDEDKYLPYSSSPFLIIEVQAFSRSGGTKVYLIFKEGSPQEFEAFFMLNANDINEFSVFQEIPTNKKIDQLIKKLRAKQFDRFWIPAPDLK